jgi:hypothetical protein
MSLIAVTNWVWLVAYVCADLMLYLLIKALQRDLIYWVPGLGYGISLVQRVMIKVTLHPTRARTCARTRTSEPPDHRFMSHTLCADLETRSFAAPAVNALPLWLKNQTSQCCRSVVCTHAQTTNAHPHRLHAHARTDANTSSGLQVLVDFTGNVHFRHPMDMSGLLWALSIFLGQVSCVCGAFLYSAFYEGARANRCCAGRCGPLPSGQTP